MSTKLSKLTLFTFFTLFIFIQPGCKKSEIQQVITPGTLITVNATFVLPTRQQLGLQGYNYNSSFDTSPIKISFQITPTATPLTITFEKIANSTIPALNTSQTIQFIVTDQISSLVDKSLKDNVDYDFKFYAVDAFNNANRVLGKVTNIPIETPTQYKGKIYNGISFDAVF